jgi:ATP-binding cassette, subfamily B, bacterial
VEVAVPRKREEGRTGGVRGWGALWELVRRFVWQDGLAIAGSAVLAVVAAMLGLAVPGLLGKATDAFSGRGEGGSGGGGVAQAVLSLGAVHVAHFCVDLCSSWLASWASERAATRMRRRVFSQLLEQDVAYFDAQRTGELASQLNEDVKEVRTALRLAIRKGLTAGTSLAGAAGLMFATSPTLSLGLVGVLCPLVLLANGVGAHLRRLASRSSAAQAAAVGVASESLANVRVVRAFGAEEAEERRFARALDEAAGRSLELGAWMGIFSAGMSLGTQALGAGVLAAGAGLVQRRQMTEGELAAFLIHTASLQGAVEQASVLLSQLQHASGTAERLVDTLHREPRANRRGGLEWHPVRGDVRFSDVHFAYPTRPAAPVLRGLDLHIPAGRTLALVGPSGSGKSTVAALLQRFYDVDSSSGGAEGAQGGGMGGDAGGAEGAEGGGMGGYAGGAEGAEGGRMGGETASATVSATTATTAAIPAKTPPPPPPPQQPLSPTSGTGGSVSIDGRDVADVDIHWLRAHMAVVPQQPALFAATIAENLRYAAPDATDAQLEAAARQAACDFVFDTRVMPHGLDTHIGEAGVSLSGGQRQRLAIARALLRDPAILILDEATSALDSASEKQVQDAIRSAAKGRTTLIIAHRLSTVRAADAIACLDSGKVAEIGTHEELVRKNGIYAQLVRHQQLQ